MKLHSLFLKFMTEYRTIYNHVWESGIFTHEFGNFVRHDIVDALKPITLRTNDEYLLKGSVGQTKWTPVPWVAIFDKRITNKATKGEYIVYLLNSETRELYLTFNQASEEKNNKAVRLKLRENAERIRSKMSFPHVVSLESISSGNEAYDSGCICSIKYTINNLPSDEELENDLMAFINIYSQYYDAFYSKQNAVVSNQHTNNFSIIPEESRGEQKVTVKESIEKIKEYIASAGFSYPGDMIENYWLCLKSKPFVILAGTSGTGKTRLVRLFAEAIGAEYQLVSVRPDWSDSSDLFGHTDLRGSFHEEIALTFIKEAIQNPTKPYFLCLDEMNLARVEYYLSDILSKIETREIKSNGEIRSDNFDSRDDELCDVYLPQNLYIVGTVNMDETTFPFSKKVLDRANTIEFSYVNLIPDFDFHSGITDKLALTNDFLKTDYLILKDCQADKDFMISVCTQLDEINQKLKKAEAHVGYRVRDEICFYLLNNKHEGLIGEDAAFDNEIMQKILPRIQGSNAQIKNVLCDLFKFCAGDYRNDTGTDADNMQAYLDGKKVRYQKSAEKIILMVRRYDEDGFTSYWL